MACSYCARATPRLMAAAAAACSVALRLDHGNVVVDPGVVIALRQVERFLIGCDSIIEDLLQRILPANLKVILRQTGLFGEPLDSRGRRR